MTNAGMIEALRLCGSPDAVCKGQCPYYGVENCLSKKDLDAADALEAAEKRIAELEAQLPKEGEWIPVTNGRGGHECSLCHGYAPTYQNGDEHLSDYCPSCGARMKDHADAN